MSYRSMLSYPLFKDAAMLSPIASKAAFVGHLKNYSLIVFWNGLSPVGEIFIDVTFDDVNDSNINITWITLDFGAPISISGNTGRHFLVIQHTPARFIRARYDHTSGSGSLFVTLSGI